MKDFPKACFKGELHDRLNDLPTRKVRETTIKKIVELKKVSETVARRMKIIDKEVCRAVMVEFGEIDE